jgi:hypothetical protein
MSETHCAPVVLTNTVADTLVKFQFPESMNFDPMSIHAHPASEDSRPTASLSVHPDGKSSPRGRFTPTSLELSVSMAFDGCGEPSR